LEKAKANSASRQENRQAKQDIDFNYLSHFAAFKSFEMACQTSMRLGAALNNIQHRE
jgi:hypothetical protein